MLRNSILFPPKDKSSAAISGGSLAPVSEKNIQHLMAKKAYGTTAPDIKNTGTPRTPNRGQAWTFGGVDGKGVIGNVGNIQYVQTWVNQPIDNQILFALQNSTATAISVVAGVLTFGGSITIGSIFVDGVSKSAAAAGVILNDNADHLLYIDFTQIAASNLVLGTDGTGFGNVILDDFRVGDTTEPVADVLLVVDDPNYLHGTETGHWKLDEEVGTDILNSVDPTVSGTLNGGVTNSQQDVVSFHDEEGYTISDGATYYKEAALTNLIANNVKIPKVNGQNKCAAYVTGGVLGALEFSGKTPKHGDLVNSHCVTLDGLDDKISLSLTGNTLTSLSIRVKLISDNQGILTLQNKDGTKVAVISGVLTFGGLIASSISNLKIDNVSKTEVEAGVILNDNNFHTLSFDTNYALTVFKIGATSGSVYGNISISDLQLNGGSLANWSFAEGSGINLWDKSGNNNSVTAIGMTSTELWANTQDVYHNNVINGWEEYTDNATGLITIKVPYKSDGTKITPTIAGYTKQADHPSGACLHPDSRAFFGSGYLKVSDVKEGETILQEDGTYKEIKRFYQKEVDEELVEIKGRIVPAIKVTGDHKIKIVNGKEVYRQRKLRNTRKTRGQDIPDFVMNQEWIKSDNLNVGDYLIVPKPTHLLSQDNYLNFNGKEILVDEEIAEILGWFVAEGSTSTHQNSYKIQFDLSYEEQYEAERIAKLLKDKLDVNSTIFAPKNSIIRIKAYSKELVYLLDEFVDKGAKNKKVPSFIMNSPDNVVKAFLRSYNNGDGCIHEGNNPKYYRYASWSSISPKLISDVSLLIMKLGVLPAIYQMNEEGDKDFQGRKTHVQVNWNIKITGDDIGILFNKEEKQLRYNYYISDEDNFYTPITRLSREQYKGIVYDFETETHTLGMPFVIHNSHNGAETEWKPNPNNDPKQIYQNNIDSTTVRAYGDVFVSPEYMDQSVANRHKNYLQYLNTLTAAEKTKIEAFENI